MHEKSKPPHLFLDEYQRTAVLDAANRLERLRQASMARVRQVLGTPYFHPVLRQSFDPYVREIRALYKTLGLPLVGMELLTLFSEAYRKFGEKNIRTDFQPHALEILEKAITEALDYIRDAVK